MCHWMALFKTTKLVDVSRVTNQILFPLIYFFLSAFSMKNISPFLSLALRRTYLSANWSTLVHATLMTCCLFGTRPSLEPMTYYFKSNPKKIILDEIWIKIHFFFQENAFGNLSEKCQPRPQNLFEATESKHLCKVSSNRQRYISLLLQCQKLGKYFEIRHTSYVQLFRVTGHLCREFTGHRWIPLTKASDAELWCFLWSALE